MARGDRTDSRRQAQLFLMDVHRRADHYAQRIDPDQRRHYARDPVLRALDAITAAVSSALSIVRPGWREEDE